jgi:VanZ family protein
MPGSSSTKPDLSQGVVLEAAVPAYVRYLISALTVLCWLGLTVVLLMPSSGLPSTPTSDKINHLLGFGVMTCLTLMSLWLHRPGWVSGGYAVIAFAMLYSAATEYLQTLPMIGRSGELADWMANCAGICIGTVLAYVLRVCCLGLICTQLKHSQASNP